jgi:hypothetical protein
MGRLPSGAPLALTLEPDKLSLAGDGVRRRAYSKHEPRAGLPGTSGASVNRRGVLRQGLPSSRPLKKGCQIFAL